MSTTRSSVDTFSIIIGAFLLIEGIWGLFSDVVFGVLATNLTHAVIHIALGIIAIWTGMSGRARGFIIFLGALLLIVGVAWFIPGLSDIVVSLFNVNQAVAILNIVVGIVSLIVAFTARNRPVGHDPVVP